MDETTDPRRAIPGLRQVDAAQTTASAGEIRGSTTVLELLRLYPDGRAAELLADLQLPCAHCGGAVREPLSLAARRHRRDPRAVLEAFRALAGDGPTPEQRAAARERHPERWPAAASRRAAASGRAPQ